MPLTPGTQADSELERLLAKSSDSALHLFGDSSHGRLRLGVRPQLALHAHPQRSSGAAGPICTAGHFLPTEDLNPPVFGSTSSTRWPVLASSCLGHPLRADSSIVPSPPSSQTMPRCRESDAAPTPVLKRANFWLRGGLWCLHRLYDLRGPWFLHCNYHSLRIGNFFFKCADRFSEQGNRPLLVL